ncbi:hypothetical protein KY334_01390 [Candidatus Woesearchaeota archaeon]|nr:hypothetical protein [Candidatus Woesearchaeota archaeon]
MKKVLIAFEIISDGRFCGDLSGDHGKQTCPQLENGRCKLFYMLDKGIRSDECIQAEELFNKVMELKI